MNKWFNILVILCVSFFSVSFVYSQVEIKVSDANRNYVSMDTLVVTIDSNSQNFPYLKTMKCNLYNYTTNTVYFDLEFDWVCSNSDLSVQICEHFDATKGLCHLFHQEGKVLYNNHSLRKVSPDINNNDNFMAFDIGIRYYAVEDKYEKYGKISVLKSNTNIVLDSLYLVIRRGTLPCHISQPADTSPDTTGTHINTLSAGNFNIYPNPASDHITIRSENNELQSYFLYAIDGSIIKSGKAEDLTDATLNVSDVPGGMYFLKIIDRKHYAYVRKIVVSH